MRDLTHAKSDWTKHRKIVILSFYKFSKFFQFFNSESDLAGVKIMSAKIIFFISRRKKFPKFTAKMDFKPIR